MVRGQWGPQGFEDCTQGRSSVTHQEVWEMSAKTPECWNPTICLQYWTCAKAKQNKAIWLSVMCQVTGIIKTKWLVFRGGLILHLVIIYEK